MLLLFVLFAAALSVAVVLLVVWAGTGAKESASADKLSDDLLRAPNWPDIENQLGFPVPAIVRSELYDPRICLKRNVAIRTETGTWQIMCFNPAGLALSRAGTRFHFATDPCGNQYSIDIALPDSVVCHEDHDTGDITRVSVTLREFIIAVNEAVKAGTV